MAIVGYVKSTLTSDGTSTGVITVASTASYAAGAIVFLAGTGLATKQLTVASIINATTLFVKISNGFTYNYFDASAYTVAASSTITQPSQDVISDNNISIGGSETASAFIATNSAGAVGFMMNAGALLSFDNTGTYTMSLSGTSLVFTGFTNIVLPPATFSGTITSSVASGSNALSLLAGARIKWSDTANSYLDTDGTGILRWAGTALQLTAAGSVFYTDNIQNNTQSAVAGTALVISNVTNTNGTVPLVIKSGNVLTAGKITSIFNSTTEEAFIDFQGRGSFGLGTTAGTGASLTIKANTAIDGGNASSFGTMLKMPSADFWRTDSTFQVGALKIGGSPAILQGSSSAIVTYQSNLVDSATAIAHAFNNINGAYVTAGAKLVSIQNNSVEKFAVDKDGLTVVSYLDTSATPGSATANTVKGRSAVANASSAATITNSLVTATSIVRVQLETIGIGISAMVSIPSAGSFTVTTVNALGVATNVTGTTKFSWKVD